ncbi:hypothetical protein MZD04_gp050 [Pseudomonas phage Psa21]|uniref:Uncharacterized protein n=1 Tax=Pseudomonas phage Psa21 TaxID=2530023 RepID=A0A481W4C8_9CAUD|nr:hypothetical protein MZD04_gp050 [Pseudomonas phage Psa21]QBJ02580.1 hypothetical protein PSA21_50 [Pseudomonas phage Psa21]
MQLWLVERTDNVTHDQVQAYVCSALNADDALLMNDHPGDWEKAYWNGWYVPDTEWVKIKEKYAGNVLKRREWKVTAIGYAHDTTEAKLICIDFLEP